jgi:hypothetical protein
VEVVAAAINTNFLLSNYQIRTHIFLFFDFIVLILIHIKFVFLLSHKRRLKDKNYRDKE